jgi:UDP-N-acetylglucosamine 2-epimerase
VLLRERPDLVVVVGHVNSIVAALCATKLGVPVANVDAGLRSGDRTMPDELNRLLTNQLADCSSPRSAAPPRSWPARALPPPRSNSSATP